MGPDRGGTLPSAGGARRSFAVCAPGAGVSGPDDPAGAGPAHRDVPRVRAARTERPDEQVPHPPGRLDLLIGTFREYGLPERILTGNGSPWGSVRAARTRGT